MIREAGDYRYEQERSLEQALTFEETEKLSDQSRGGFGSTGVR